MGDSIITTTHPINQKKSSHHHQRFSQFFLWSSAAVFFFLLLVINALGQANAEEDSDLVFDALDQSSSKFVHSDNHRIAKRIPSSSFKDINNNNKYNANVREENSSPSEPVPEHWLTNTVNRIKRSLGSLFSSSSSSTSSSSSSNGGSSDSKIVNDHDDKKSALKVNDGKLKRSPQELGQQEAVDDYEDEDDDDDNNHSNNDYNAQFQQSIDETQNQIGDDDEDAFEGESGSGPSTNPPFDDSHPLYFRFIITLGEPYVPEFADRNSHQFQEMSGRIKRAIEEIYDGLPGVQTASVLKIEPVKEDKFKIQVTLDLDSNQYSRVDKIINLLKSNITERHTLGDITAFPEGFRANIFEDNRPNCDATELICRSGECVPQTSRCDGKSDCRDGSDEDGCPDYHITKNKESEFFTPELHSSTPTMPPDLFDGGSGDGETSTSDRTVFNNIPVHCRSDDIKICKDNLRYICAEQFCDGKSDCDDGSDELDCRKIDCAVGEFICDITRCLPLSYRCNGNYDCTDRTDEHDCQIDCPGGIVCDGNKCIPSDRKCNRIRDCDDGADELHCSVCRPTDFDCGDGNCIPGHLRCDNRPDCPNSADERNCQHGGGAERCKSDQFTCGTGHCIPKSQRCDQTNDCPDKSDERNCPCSANEARCNNGFCLPKTLWCNGVKNCQDGSDEYNCSTSGCQSYQWQCADGTCVDQTQRCDSHTDCPDRSDEVDCIHCKHDEFRCNTGTCINLMKRCDGVSDCIFSEDEESCANCGAGMFKCFDGRCIDERGRCNNIRDCADGSDELNCHEMPLVCIEHTWKCHTDKKCIKLSNVCNGISDCEDGSDEQFCNSEAAAFTSPPENIEDDCGDKLRCSDGSCVIGGKCDHIIDCFDGSDEQNCTFCQNFEFRCSDGTCIREDLKCNRQYDCSDGSDETDCVDHCPADQFRCSNGMCLDQRRVCDGYPDCPEDGSDETNCQRRCTGNEFDCGNGQCIGHASVCDGYPDCSNSRDEQSCNAVCQDNEFECASDSRCLPENQRCNGVDDCDDGSDELDCPPPKKCGQYLFTCDDGTCIDQRQHCDGYRDCPDGSDESDCRFRNIEVECTSNQMRCANGKCIDLSLRCNYQDDCNDGRASDEIGCPTQAPYPPPTEIPATRCPPGMHPCQSGSQCIHPQQMCDGRADCDDYSDESSCPGSGDGLLLKTYPSSQEIKENIYKPDREVVFTCRDEGPIRARVHWIRANGQPLPPGSRDINGRLEIPNIKVEHGGTYICEAEGYPASTPGARVSVQLHVDKWITPTYRPPTACGLHQATCSNGDCISKSLVCDGNFDCTDGSDENRCNPHGCEPNEFRCSNKKCILKTWICDSDDDCGDGSDEAHCAPTPPGAICSTHQFTCHSNNQCIPRSFHCDMQPDCVDRSDEIGCATPVISRGPPPMVNLDVGATFEITCTAVGVPTPEISWRLNWGHIPLKCKTTSQNGVGTLSCADIQVEDQGAYSCEAINIKGAVFAVPDTILVVKQYSVCPAGFFNTEARTESECIKCFCFGHTSNCRSADLFIYQFQPPFDALRLLGVRTDPRTGAVEIRDEPIYRNVQPQLTPIGRNGIHSSIPYGAEIEQANLAPYFAMPENYHGNQLKSYGGFLRYKIHHTNRGRPIPGPDVILSGNGYTLVHQSNQGPPVPNTDTNIEVRFFEGWWWKRSESAPEIRASREEIMMTLADVNNLLIKLQYNEGSLNTTLDHIEMDSAAAPNSGLGAAVYVEQCTCPVGYTGLSCERCADGYVRHSSGPWLGQCYKEERPCPPGSYNDGSGCKICPCPFANPTNQFGRTCSLHPDGDVVCDCPPGYEGRRCEKCAAGYSGNPMIPGDSCRPGVLINCNPNGTDNSLDGRCHCKINTDGPSCDQCKANTFHLSRNNQFGCIACFCMGVTQQCTSSHWYRDQITSVFASSTNEFQLIDPLNQEPPLTDSIRLIQENREIAYSNFPMTNNVYYWSLPKRYLGNKISSYGGYLRYTLKNIPVPGGQSSRNSAADVQIVSQNEITLLYYAREQSHLSNQAQTFEVPLLEQYWQRQDGQKADREHLLMALADVKEIYIKATYFTNTQEATLSSVSLDIASDRNTGLSRALEVEQCQCLPGYKGLSCEDCDVGYTRSLGGLYLGLCEPCQCNGHSSECDPENGECFNCKDYTTGENCERCLPGYEGDPASGIPCRYRGGEGQTCRCDSRGATSTECYNGQCNCKSNVEGSNCDRCRAGSFGLNASNVDGCEVCFCSGVSSECTESNLYIDQIPYQILTTDGFILTDQNHVNRISDHFVVNGAMNEISYNFLPSQQETLYWSLPSEFTGNKILSYGGNLEYTQRYTQRPYAKYIPDQDVIINGNGITISWSNPSILPENVPNRVMVPIHPSARWFRLDQNKERRPASREDILTALANIETILIRASQSSDIASAHLSDIVLDTAADYYSPGQQKASRIELCKCPEGYRGTSCESCAPGYYRDLYYGSSNPLGACTRCPCNGNEESCQTGPDRRVNCICKPGFTGRACEVPSGHVIPTPTPGPWPTNPPNPPTIDITIITPGIKIFEIGSTVRYNCSARSNLAPRTVRVRWNKENGFLPNHAIDDGRGLLVITNLKVSDSGRYTCEADDGYSIVTQSVDLTVGTSQETRPRVAISPPYVDVYENQPAEIRCAAQGTPTPNLRVMRVDGKLLNPTHQFQDGHFRIPYAQLADSGEYQCIATNPKGTDVGHFQIDVRQNVGTIVRVDIQPPYYSGNTDDTVTLKCVTNENVENIRWSKENADLPYHSREDNGVLTILGARPEDSGVYICTVTSYTGSSGSQRATVTISRTSQGHHPTASVTPERVTINQGSSVELRCDATGEPVPRIKWTKVGSELGRNAEQLGSILRIRNAQMEDRGVYVCVASNSVGLSQATAMVDITRLEPPRVEIYPKEHQVVVAGNSALLQCRVVAGEPAPSVTWTRPSGLPLSRNIEQMSQGALRFTQITQSEEGEYICTATNEAGKTEAIAHIVVHTLPDIFITPSQEVITKNEKDFLRLECQATGVPQPNVVWNRYDGRRTSSNAEPFGNVQNVAVHEINRLSTEDSGFYICKAQNSAGVLEKRVQLIVDRLPTRGDITERPYGGEDATAGSGPSYKHNEGPGAYPPPRNIDQEFTAPVGTKAELRCRITDESKQIYVNWVRADNSSLPPDAYIRGGNLYIDNVQPSAGGLYRCLGTDRSTGRIEFTLNTQLRVVSPPRITLQPPRQVVFPGQNAEIQCSATGEQPITITWSPVNRAMPRSAYTNGGYLQFRNIQINDTGRYRCSARNNAGEADSVADVVVEERVQVHRPANANHREQSAPIGSSVTLECRTPQPVDPRNIHWFREAEPLPRNSTVKGDILHIYNLQPADQGRYYCQVESQSGTSSFYIDLHITNDQLWICEANEWTCRNLKCIPNEMWCDDNDDCGDGSDEEDCGLRTRRDPKIVNVPPMLHITPPETEYRAGQHVDIVCQSSEPGVITTWSKLFGRLPDNAQDIGGTLRFISLREDNSGIYRCEATGHSGLYNKDYSLRVAPNPEINDDTPVQTKVAERGSTVLLDCRTDLDGPVNYVWSKQSGQLPRDIDTTRKSIMLNTIGSADAGTYICTASNGKRSIDTPIILVVTGIVPYFTQAPNSYIALQPLEDAYIAFNLEISFKPENGNGLLLYNGNKGNDKTGDFISLALVDSVPEFRYNLGHSTTVVKADRPIANRQWHTVKINRIRKKVTMYVDGEGPFTANAEGKYIGLDLMENLHFGGVPDYNQISPEANVYQGFVGCISLFKVGFSHLDIQQEAIAKHGITTCETCTENKCENQGACQEALSKEGYVCICPTGFSGPTCRKLKGEACSPHVCGNGKCFDTENSYECQCPLGYTGKQCERQIVITEPAFKNNAFMAYQTPKPSRKVKINMRIKPREIKDGILLYCGETDEGHGDFISLAVRNGRLEFRFDAGNGNTVITHPDDLAPNQWTAITAIRSLSDGKLIINAGRPISGRVNGNHKTLNLQTPLYIGGYDKHRIKVNNQVMVHDGFDGCISDVSVTGLENNSRDNVTESSNVEDCNGNDQDFDNNIYNGGSNNFEDNNLFKPISYNSRQTGCSSAPCQNNGQCSPLSPTEYMCTCLPGFTGKDCESKMDLCDSYPCQSGGTCHSNITNFMCDCPLGYTGVNCEQRTELRNDVHFSGNGFLEFERSLLPHEDDDAEELIAVELSTNSSDGLIFWHGQGANQDGQGQDYISLAIQNGYLEFSYDLGTGPAVISNQQIRVDDGNRHSVILKRTGRAGSIDIDNQFSEEGEAEGFTDTMNCDGNIYLGGTPNVTLMTGGRFNKGFDGCIHGFEIQDSKTIDLGVKAINGVNAKPCSSSEFSNDLDFERIN